MPKGIRIPLHGLLIRTRESLNIGTLQTDQFKPDDSAIIQFCFTDGVLGIRDIACHESLETFEP
jgi:hypothetical protein